MPIPITIPRLGWNMDEGTFLGWLQHAGDPIRAGDSLFSLESEKAIEDVECLDSGLLYLSPGGPREGDRVRVGQVIGYLLQAGEAPPEGEKEALAVPEIPAVGHSTLERTLPPRLDENKGRKTTLSPRARRLAAQLGIDPGQLAGTGRTGRIRARDVQAALPVPGGTSPASLPLSPIRRTIAERLRHSLQSTVPVTLTTEVDAAGLVRMRQQQKATTPAGQEAPGYTDFLIQLSALALQKHPWLCARWEKDQIRMAAAIHIGFAVDTEAGLLVPVIRDVLGLTLGQLAERSRDLADRARRGKLRAEEMQEGTFTITNLGPWGIDAFTPIINFPQCAILGVGRIRPAPVVRENQVVPGEVMTLSLTFDHQVVDGARAAGFLQTLARLLENPGFQRPA